ncbi:MAG: hypothetical protein WBG01_11085 [Bacteroidota bacterium]
MNTHHSPGRAIVIFMLLVACFHPGLADGTETLGPPKGVTLAGGTGIYAAGVGLADPAFPKIIVLSLPDRVDIKQVLFYWEGQTTFGGDLDVHFTINEKDVYAWDPGDASDGGNRIGEPVHFYSDTKDTLDPDDDVVYYTVAFRVDITTLDVVHPGKSTLEIGMLDGFGHITSGAGVLVIYADPSEAESQISVRDGIDPAYYDFPEPRKSTVPQTFTFEPSEDLREARLSLLFSSVSGAWSPGDPIRPTSIEVTVGGKTRKYSDQIGSLDGPEWDSANLTIRIPPGATSVTVQAFSRDDTGSAIPPASLIWIAAALSLPPPR